jgi:3-hydroxyisobutyrate dehydrogenase
VKQFLPGKYEPPAMQLKLGHKDVGLAVGLGKELGVPLRLSNMVFEEITEAIGRGFGDQDSRSFMKLQVERAGVEIAVDPERLQRAVERNS